jgi:hypothetical protein
LHERKPIKTKHKDTPDGLLDTIENKYEELDPAGKLIMKQNQKVKKTGSLNPPNCFMNGNDLLVIDQYIKLAKAVTRSQLIMQCNSKKLFIEEEKCTASLQIREVKEPRAKKVVVT